MAYQLASDVKALSVGFSRRKGGTIGRGELPTPLFDALIQEGVIVQSRPAGEVEANQGIGSVDTGDTRSLPNTSSTSGVRSSVELGNLTVKELRALAKERGIPVAGKRKAELVGALQ